MLIIAERINATRRPIAEALKARDAARIRREARRQAEAGADFIDLNAGADPAREAEDLLWTIEQVRQVTDLPLCLDSSNPEVLRAGLEALGEQQVMLNSVTGEAEKLAAVLPLAAQARARLVALTMDESGLPQTADQRLRVAEKIIEAATRQGVPVENLYVDPCIQPLSTSPEQAREALEAVRRIMDGFEGIHTTCGLSNISFGLPGRALVNRTYLACLIMAGLDSAILDPLAEGLMETVRAAEALAGRDEFCMNYIQFMRSRT